MPSSSSLVSGTNGTFTDSRDSKVYKWVKIGSQTWIAENLNYNANGSGCYDDLESNCDKYGRLYDWATANAACPSGWHLPSNADWNVLLKVVDYAKGGGGWEGSCATGTCYDSYTAGWNLKSTSGWNDYYGKPGNGTDDFGFSALPGGYGYGYGVGGFGSVGDEGNWWISSEYNSYAYYRSMHCGQDGVGRHYDSKVYLFSVRCLKD